MPMVKVVTYVDVGPRHVLGEKRRFLKSENNKQNSESGEVLVFTLSLRVDVKIIRGKPFPTFIILLLTSLEVIFYISV